MLKFYATQGQIPKRGEIWMPVGGKRHLMMLHLFDIEKVRKFVPHGLDIVACWPGKTIGSTFFG
ncbi:MAG: hypothetical protein ACOZF0_02535 [Thermodesulfobacteriota bacterium]